MGDDKSFADHLSDASSSSPTPSGQGQIQSSSKPLLAPGTLKDVKPAGPTATPTQAAAAYKKVGEMGTTPAAGGSTDETA